MKLGRLLRNCENFSDGSFAALLMTISLLQARYLSTLHSLGLLRQQLPGYLVLLLGWVQEEYVVMDYLWKIV